MGASEKQNKGFHSDQAYFDNSGCLNHGTTRKGNAFLKTADYVEETRPQPIVTNLTMSKLIRRCDILLQQKVYI